MDDKIKLLKQVVLTAPKEFEVTLTVKTIKEYLEIIKGDILQKFCDLDCKLENNNCYASYDDIENILNNTIK